jgi:hypothetical protein
MGFRIRDWATFSSLAIPGWTSTSIRGRGLEEKHLRSILLLLIHLSFTLVYVHLLYEGTCQLPISEFNLKATCTLDPPIGAIYSVDNKVSKVPPRTS